MNVVVFDIETIPDVAGLRILHELPDTLDDREVAEHAFQTRRAATGSDFIPLHLQRVVTISCVYRNADNLKVFSLAAPELSEAEIIQRFFSGIERMGPHLVSWNGGGFDLPVLHYRGLMHRVVAPRYWNQGDHADSREYRYNNYISRYHNRHLDLMDLLALYQPRAAVPLDALAKLMGYPGKLGMDGSAVWDAWHAGRHADIRDYCETDVANTYLVYLAFEHMRGHLDTARWTEEVALLRQVITNSTGAHWEAFLAAWSTDSASGSDAP